MTVADRRDAVAFLRTKGVSERRACRLFGLGRSSLRYRPREGRDEALRQRLLGLARRHPRYGYRRAWAVLQREGWTVNLITPAWKKLMIGQVFQADSEPCQTGKCDSLSCRGNMRVISTRGRESC